MRSRKGKRDFSVPIILMKDVANRRYTWEIIAEKYDHLFQKVLKSEEKIPATQKHSEYSRKSIQYQDVHHVQ